MNKIKRRLSMTINGGNGPLGTITADQLRKSFDFLQSDGNSISPILLLAKCNFMLF